MKADKWDAVGAFAMAVLTVGYSVPNRDYLSVTQPWMRSSNRKTAVAVLLRRCCRSLAWDLKCKLPKNNNRSDLNLQQYDRENPKSCSAHVVEGPRMYFSPYSVVSDSTAAMPSSVGQTSVPLSSNSASSGGHFFHRGVQQSPVFNPLLSNQGQSLYSGVFSTQTAYSSQNSFPTTNFNSYGHVEPPPWIAETRVTPAVSSTLQQIERDRDSRVQYSEKTISCNRQSLSHTCCGNRIAIAENIGICSPLSTEAYRTVSKELLSMQSKSNNSLESQGWFCNQGMTGYGNQQNQNSQQANYKCSEQFSSCSVSQINMLLQDQSDLKHSSDSTFDHSQHEGSNTNKQTNQCSNSGSLKSVCVEQNKEQSIKYCNLQKVLQNGQPMEHIQPPVQLKEQNGYMGPLLYGSAGELHEDTLYSQASLVLHVGSDGSHNTGRFQSHFVPPKTQNNTVDTSKCYAISPVAQHFQEHGRCDLDAGMSCDVIDSCLQTDIKIVNENSVNISSSNTCCQLSVEPTSNQSVFDMQKSAVNCMSECNVAITDGIELCSNSQQLQIECSEAESKENSSQESTSITGESDIVVEESEEEMTESEISIEEIKGTVFREQESATCLVCSLSADTSNQFIHMQGDSPVTSASHIPVVTKLAQVVLDNHTLTLKLQNEFMCRRCLNLIDTVDCLETKLAAVKQDLIQLFETRQVSLKALENWKVSDDTADKIANESKSCRDIPRTTDLLENTSKNLSIDDLDTNTDKSCEHEEIKDKDDENGRIEEFDKKVITEFKKTDIAFDKQNAYNEGSESTCDVPLEVEVASELKVQCGVCSKSFSSKEYLNKHHQQHHTKQFGFYCDRCGKGFTVRCALENHLLLHAGEFRYQCELCGKLFIQRYSLDDHLRKHEGRFRLTCQQCGKGFMCRNSLHIHTRTHTGERPFVCQHCGKGFSASSNLVTHIRVCSGDLPFHCKQCNKSFALMAQLGAHVLSQHEGQYRFKCTVCGKGFIKDSDRKVHERSHSGEKPHKCVVCGKCYSSIGNLNQHAKRHNGERPFKCLVCGQGFLRRSTLAGHMNQHNGARPFGCDQCNKTFVAKRNLHAHRKWHAGTIKRYTCTICGKSFNHGLQVHMRTHSGYKPYTCSECDMAFTVRSTLNKHMKSKHQKTLDTQFKKQP